MRRSMAGDRALGLLLVGLASCSIDDRPVGVLSTEMRSEQPANRSGDRRAAAPIGIGSGGAAAAASPALPPAAGVPGGSEVTPPAAVSPGAALQPAVNDMPLADGLSLDALDPSRTGVAFSGATCNVARAG